MEINGWQEKTRVFNLDPISRLDMLRMSRRRDESSLCNARLFRCCHFLDQRRTCCSACLFFFFHLLSSLCFVDGKKKRKSATWFLACMHHLLSSIKVHSMLTWCTFHPSRFTSRVSYDTLVCFCLIGCYTGCGRERFKFMQSVSSWVSDSSIL